MVVVFLPLFSLAGLSPALLVSRLVFLGPMILLFLIGFRFPYLADPTLWTIPVATKELPFVVAGQSPVVPAPSSSPTFQGFLVGETISSHVSWLVAVVAFVVRSVPGHGVILWPTNVMEGPSSSLMSKGQCSLCGRLGLSHIRGLRIGGWSMV